MKDWNIKSDPVFDKFNNATVGKLATLEARFASNDFLRFKPEVILKLAEGFVTPDNMIQYKGENEEQINAAGRYIERGVVERPKWFDPIIKGNQESLEECVKIALQYKHINEVPQRIKNRMWYHTDKKTVRELLKDLEWTRRPRTDEEILDIMDDFKTAADMRKHSTEFKNLLSKVASNEADYPKSYIRYKEMCGGHTTRSKRGNYAQRDPRIEQYDLNGNYIKTFNTWNDVVEAGFNRGTVTGAIRGTNGQKTAKGFIWKFENK